MTAEQQRVFDAMRRHGFITDDYYDLTKQREKVRKEREEKAEKQKKLSNKALHIEDKPGVCK